jgi:uncharacterized short protein YbdD (DUF466 family)
MGIHDSIKSVEENYNSSEYIEVFENRSNDNLGEMNQYANNVEHMHDEKHDDSIVITNEELYKQEQPENECNEYFKADLIKTLIQKQIIENRRNDIMRSVTSNKQYVKSKVNEVISGEKSKKYLNNNAHSIRLDNLRNTHNINKPFNRNNFSKQRPEVNDRVFIEKSPPEVNDTVFIEKSPPEVNDTVFIEKSPPEVNDTVFIEKSPPEVNDTVFIEKSPDKSPNGVPIYFHIPLYHELIPPTIENPKGVNLAEIITNTLQDTLAGKITTIENVIGKLRVDFEEKNVFANSNKRNLILLNFEDDTMRPVLKIDEKYMNIIEQWYNMCELFIDIEETNVSIPEAITIQDVSGVLFQDINYKFKEEYLNSYIPLVINNIISERNTKSLEKKYFKKQSEYKNQLIKHPIDTDKIISDLGITIPENIIPETNKPTATSRIYFEIEPFRIHEIDDQSLVKKHILTNTESKDNIIHPFNEVQSFNIENENICTCFNSRYNSLYPAFSDNCLMLDELYGKEPYKESHVYVLINNKFLQCITIVDPSTDILYIINNYPEFGFIKLFEFETNNEDIIYFIEKEFNKIQFINVDEINKKLLFTSQFIEFSNKHNKSINIVSSEENQVKHFFDINYTISNDINHRMKASLLYDSIIMSNFVKLDNDKLSGFRTRLSKYLKDIGLQKKRYNDGFYYYGIVKKNTSPENNNPLTIEELINTRDEEIKKYQFNYTDRKEK